jgi:hypothetical protein
MVHNRGLVDQRYLETIGEDLAVAQRLEISPSEVKTYAAVVQDVVGAILGALADEHGRGT